MRPSSVLRYAWETDWLVSLGLLLISRYFLFTLSYVVLVKRKEEGSLHERKERGWGSSFTYTVFSSNSFFYAVCAVDYDSRPTAAIDCDATIN